MQAPCHKCTQRHFKCHSDCEKYLEFSKQQHEISSNRREARERENFYEAVFTRLANKNYV